MSESSKRRLNPSDLLHQSVALNRLDDHLDQSNPLVADAVEELETIARLQNVVDVEDIGKEAEHWRNYLSTEYGTKNALGISKSLDNEHKSELRGKVNAWWAKFEQHVSDEVYTVNSASDIPSDKLFSGSSSFLNVPVSDELETEIHDFDDACIEVLIGSYTSAEFLSLRATEGVLRRWFEVTTSEDLEYESWYTAIESATSREDSNRRKDLKLLDYLRDRRNEVAHPDRRSDRRDAETTLKNAFVVTETLIAEINEETGFGTDDNESESII